jgi:hypothetical protein
MLNKLSDVDAVRAYHGAYVNPQTFRVEGGEQVERRLAQLVIELRAQLQRAAVIEQEWLDACEVVQAYCRTHRVGVPGHSVFTALVQDAERLRTTLTDAAEEPESMRFPNDRS